MYSGNINSSLQPYPCHSRTRQSESSTSICDRISCPPLASFRARAFSAGPFSIFVFLSGDGDAPVVISSPMFCGTKQSVRAGYQVAVGIACVLTEEPAGDAVKSL